MHGATHINKRKTRLEKHVAGMGTNTNIYCGFVINLKERNCLEDLSVVGKVITQWKEYNRK
jgi:hypothetical protein